MLANPAPKRNNVGGSGVGVDSSRSVKKAPPDSYKDDLLAEPQFSIGLGKGPVIWAQSHLVDKEFWSIDKKSLKIIDEDSNVRYPAEIDKALITPSGLTIQVALLRS